MICDFCHKAELKLKWVGQEHDIYECSVCGMKHTEFKPFVKDIAPVIDVEKPSEGRFDL